MYAYTTERVGDQIVQVIADENPMSPREWDNFTEIYGEHRSYDIGDGKPPAEHMRILERGGIALFWRYLRRFGDPRDGSKVLAFAKLGMIDHSGVSFYTVDVGQSGVHPIDYGGWDSGSVGYVMITQKRWDELGGSDPNEPVDGEVTIGFGRIPVKVTRARHILDTEVEEYDDWSRGNVWGIVVSKPCDHADEHDTDEERADCPHSEVTDSVWGFIGDPDDVLRENRGDLGV